jgi:hypothetical protein
MAEAEARESEMPRFPLKASANGRYLVDANGVPFFYHAETGWRIAIRLTRDEIAAYLDDRKARGFNAIHVHAVNKEKEGARNRDGHEPFDPPTDVTRPNEPYWRHLDHVLEAAAARGLLIAISAAWFGAGGKGWRPDLNPENARAYGRYLGQRYRRFDNLWWIQGGDNNPGDKAEVSRALAAGIRETAPHHLQTYHAARDHASAFFFAEEDWLDINFAYTYLVTYQQVREEYRRAGRVRPIVLSETGYEGEKNPGYIVEARHIRRQAYWALLSGACGHAYGSATIWHFGDGWREAMDKPGLRHMKHVRTLFESVPWWRLVPDVNGELLTEGVGTDGQDDFAVAARTTDDAKAVVYLPTPRPVRLDLSRLRGTVTARWYDPTTGESRDAATDSARRFSPPEKNAAGDGDWALVLESAA